MTNTFFRKTESQLAYFPFDVFQVLRHKSMVSGESALQVWTTSTERPEQGRPLYANGLGVNSSRWLRLGKVQRYERTTWPTLFQLRVQLLSRVSTIGTPC